MAAKKKTARRPRTNTGRAKRNSSVHARPFRAGLSDKSAIVALYHAFKFTKEVKTPELNLTLKDPASSFMIDVYEAIGKLSKKTLYEVINELTGAEPQGLDEASMIGQLKRLFHAMFYEEPQNAEVVLRYDSVWKMWPNVRRKPRKEKEMSTAKKAPAKKAKAKKKTPTKLTAAAKKKVGKKKVAKKKVATKKVATSKTPELSDNTVLVKVKGKPQPKLVIRQNLVKSIPASGRTFAQLKADFSESHVKGCIRKGFIKVK